MAHHDSVLVISSSPDFPSICDLLPKATRQPSLRSGSNAAPVSNDAPAAFTSAANIWQSSRARHLEGAEISNIGPSQSATTAADLATVPAESPIKSGVEGPTLPLGGDKKKPRTAGARKKKGKTETIEPPLALDMAVADGPVAVAPPKKSGRKPRAKKDATLAQTTLPKGKVTKTAAREITKAQKKAETVSRHFTPHTSAPPELVAGPIDDSPSVFEPAMARRMDWTPPRESASVHCLADSSMEKEVSSSALSLQDHVFKNLQDTYGRTMEASGYIGAALPLTSMDVLGKRKLVEMVSCVGHRQEIPQASPTKPKVVKKKPRTITELATAAYRRPEEAERSTLSRQQDTHIPSGNLELPSEQLTAASKSASAKPKAAKKAPKPRATKKKQSPPEPILLSPTSAMRQVSNQDFVFGTASQLATEDDPVLLRALHEAMKVSNQADSDPFATPSPGNSNLAIRRRSGAGLWAAGARYGDGDLLDAEVLDLTRSSPLTLAQFAQNPPPPCPEAVLADKPPVESAYIEIEMSDDTLDLTISPPVGSPKTLPPCPPRPGGQAVRHKDSNLAVSGRPQTPPQEADFDPPPSNQEQHQLLLSQSNTPQQPQPAPPPPPSFELYTDARLAKEVASYGFKVVKKRTAMIALLNRCWESRNKTALGSTAAQAAMSTSAPNQAASPSRPRGRPRKDSLTATTEVVQAPSPAKKGRKKAGVVSGAGSEVPQPEKWPRGRPRKDSAASVSSITAPAATNPRRRSAAISDVDSDEPQVEKRSRGRPKKDATTSPATRATRAKAPPSPKRAKSPCTTQPAPTTPRRRKAPAKQIFEIPDSGSDDPFASSAPSSPDQHSDLFSSPPAVDLSVTEDTEASLIASPTTQDVSLFGYITRAVASAPPTKDPANPSWHEKMLMYDPIILEDLTAWLNAGRLDQVGFDGEVAPGDVKKWCESKSVCCLWRVNLRGKERKRF
uniref:Structure-specific endonuclease subunit SLX4 n=1 Tax=Chaetomium globosum (strain ATCC 6205 / CBS 148.51 / DSM 1962 / NBRC 6347 / NRRL 1970) TaxID=306901 RepID=SLX4_CHAGB|nr:RecName: Full=Structure-specific endonuclease subunit SLX4 [Chaetomium globosum CBS 148.51]